MEVYLQNLSKSFEGKWVFRDLSYSFNTGGFYAITGPNGSGKSTLLKIIAGYLTPTKGSIDFYEANNSIPSESLFRYLSLAAPFCEFPEELTFPELITFYQNFKALSPGVSQSRLIDLFSYQKKISLPLSQYSSGMLQRTKILLALASDTPLIILDEPTSFLDLQGKEWFKELLGTFRTPEKLIVMATNMEEERQLAEKECFLKGGV